LACSLQNICRLYNLWENQSCMPFQENGRRSRRGSLLMIASDSPASTSLSTAASDSLGHSQGLSTSSSQSTTGQTMPKAAGDTGSSQVQPPTSFTDRVGAKDMTLRTQTTFHSASIKGGRCCTTSICTKVHGVCTRQLVGNDVTMIAARVGFHFSNLF
jgi:hypothetical protein